MVDRGFDASGTDMLRASDLTAYASLTYEFNVGRGRLPVSVTYSYKDDFQFDFVVDPLADHFNQEAYEVVNARVTYHPPGETWSVSAWGRNLFDEEYFDEVTGNFTGVRGSYGAPRTYGVDVQYNF